MTGQRFQELRSKKGEPAQEWETKFLKVVNEEIKKKQKAAQTVVSELAKHSLGTNKYKEVKNAYSSGGDAKMKVDSFMSELAK